MPVVFAVAALMIMVVAVAVTVIVTVVIGMSRRFTLRAGRNGRPREDSERTHQNRAQK